MYKVTISPRWEIGSGAEAPLDTSALLGLLRAIDEGGSIAEASRSVGLSYRYAWGLLRDAERIFGHALIASGRGRGTRLTALADKLIWDDRRIAARLSPTLESLASELENELGRVLGAATGAIRLDASHGFAVAAFLHHVNAAGLPMEIRYRNSSDAVAALARRECDLAGFHVPLGEYEQQAAARYRQWLSPRSHSLVHLATRTQGLIVARDNPMDITGLADLAREGVRFVNRQDGSGTRMLLELMLPGAGLSAQQISGYENTEFTHSAVAAYIASGMADVGIGVQTAAQRFGLGFVPLVRERYFLAAASVALDSPQMRRALEILRSAAFRADVGALAGYDPGNSGTILSLADAFGAALQ
jgi:molybdate transport repressor ModE-like protein